MARCFTRAETDTQQEYMSETTALIGIGAAIALGAASPGPSFIMVAKTAACVGRRNGLAAAWGMGLGALSFSLAALFGLNALFIAAPRFYVALKVLGGLYLAYLGVRMWRGAAQSVDADSNAGMQANTRAGRHFLWALVTQMSNPKAAIVYASVFAAFMPVAPSTRFDVAVVTLVLVIETSWYSLVAWGLSASRPRSAYLRCKPVIDRVAGGIMGILGIKLATSAAG
jgi:threonine/homoserine/homoserine lactone efflux protein